MSWVHRDDALVVIARAMADSDMYGTYNLVATEPVSQTTLAQSTGQLLKRPVWQQPRAALHQPGRMHIFFRVHHAMPEPGIRLRGQ